MLEDQTSKISTMNKFLSFLAISLLVISCTSQPKSKPSKNIRQVEIGFYETYRVKEIRSNWNELKNWVKQNDSILAIHNIGGVDLNRWVTRNVPGCIGTVRAEHKEIINRILSLPETIALFPKNLKFVWSVDPEKTRENEILYTLYALKIPENGKAKITGKHIEEATVITDENSGQTSISVTMTEKGYKLWAEMTRKNIGKYIAIAVYDNVFSCPMVQHAITSGDTQISGNFSLSEAEELAGLISNSKDN